MTVRHMCSWKYEFTLKRDEEHGRNYIWSLSFILTRYPLCKKAIVSFADSMLSTLDKQDTKEGNCQNLPIQDGWSYKLPVSQKSLSDILNLPSEDDAPIL